MDKDLESALNDGINPGWGGMAPVAHTWMDEIAVAVVWPDCLHGIHEAVMYNPFSGGGSAISREGWIPKKS